MSISRFVSLMLCTAACAAPALASTQIEKGAAVSVAGATSPVEFDVFLPLRNPSDLERLLTAQQNSASPSYHKWVSPAEYAAQFGPTAATMASAQAAVTAAGLQVTTTQMRSFHVTGTVAQATALFGTGFKNVVTTDGINHVVASGPLVMSAALAATGAKVITFAGLPDKKTFSKRTTAALPDNRYGPDGPYWYNDMKQAYDYPSYQSFLPNGDRLDGTGVHAAIVISDKVYPNDLAAFFNHEHFTTTTGKPAPTVNTIDINGGGVVGGGGSFEASLDVQQVLGGAPGATATIVSIPNLQDSNIQAAYQYIVDSNLYDVVNSSFGGCEAQYTAAYNGGTDYTFILQAYDDIFRQGNAEGITFVASSGDQGGPACPSANYGTPGAKPKFGKGVSTPATSVYVTAVGGGNLVTVSDGSRNSTYVGENGFGDPEVPYDIYGLGQNVSGGYWGAGGGKSVVSPRPSYQIPINTGSNFRTTPDVGMQVGGCPSSAVQPCGPDRSSAITTYQSGLGGGNYGVIGTSVSSPQFVGALALYIQKQGKRVGNINPYLYHFGQVQTVMGGVNAPAEYQFYHRNIKGFDGLWADDFPSQNYNYINGNGTPDIRKLFGFTNFDSAGIPQSVSNP
ncbi:S53 family peptidase [Glacieibacterium megasporae]|uniref:S53 family peptidase n=1 Tax=Glacieibacterium megasporae TaxID=2835787 RepID=UPI001C1E39A9|nr:protease pro-enzyme activation domain-containing protein [Polymorphobacter megasporae]UAJ09064.1 hypothetical protein KTC28_11965 [Polymorphobacter megasporae]